MVCRVYIFVILSLATPIAAIENRSHLCRPSISSYEIFKCVQGAECVHEAYVCDGTKDCSDGSDEDSCFTRQRRQLSSCILPPYPDHGSYEILDDPLGSSRHPGEYLYTFALKVSCEQGYGITETDSDVDSGGTQVVLCVNGRWSPNMPKCVRFCKLDANPSIHYMCTGSKICKKFVSPESLVKPICNSPIYYSTETLLYMKCFAGTWNYVAKCKPECGRITPGGVQLVTGGTPAERGELPWHVGIYRKTKPYMQICGGSLVSNNVVISAAHCFWSDIRKLLSASYFAVASGKLYRSWDDARDVLAQKSDLKHIEIPKLFRGAAANFQEDIAILTLAAPFTYEKYIRPVCLNFDVSFNRWHLQQDNLGKVAGWGLTAANGVASDILKVVDMPFINEATCVNTLPPSFTAYITGDKFCAGYTNGTALCKGDSGGGIVFADREQGLSRYYLRGIVSTAPTTADKMCNDRSYTTFTKIIKHEEFIQNALAVALADNSCLSNMFTCADGTCRDREANCGQKYEYMNKFEYEDLKPVSQAVPLAVSSSKPPSSDSIYFGSVLPSVEGQEAQLTLATTQAPPPTTSTPPPTSTIPPGPPGYTYYAATGSYYKLHKSKVSWDVANTTCASEGAHLVVLNDAEEADIVVRIVRDAFGYDYATPTGLRDQRPGGVMDWRTVHGKPVSDVYNVWYDGRPANDAEYTCAAFATYYKQLYDYRCDDTGYFTCEISQQ